MESLMNKLFGLILLLLAAVLLYFLAPILTPFLVGALLAYLVDPLVRLLMRLHLPRLFAVIIVFFSVFLVLVAVVLLLIPLIETQINALTDTIPSVIAWVQVNLFPLVDKYFGPQQAVNVTTLKSTFSEHWTTAGGAASWVLKTVLHSGLTFVAWLVNLILIPVVTFYLLRDWDKLIAGARQLLPRHLEPTVVHLFTECNDVLSAFFRGQLLVMLSLGIIYSAGLTLMGLKIGIVIGAIAGLLSIVPYLGITVGIITASIAAYVQFGEFSAVLLVWLVFAIGQTLESMVLTPKLVGHRIGLHPVAVIFAVLTGGVLFGFFGVLLALPVAAVIMVMLRFLDQRYRNSPLYR
jgi:predicted PurR-regulated permease PerM